jgi:hemerythrin
MSLLEWEESFALGITEFDEHHKHLIQLLNITYDGFVHGAGNDELSAVLDELIDYATYHFAAEEHWMKEIRYPEIAAHIKEHEIFILRVLEFYQDFRAENSHLTLEVLQFLNSWLKSHILETDADYSRFAKGSSPHL